MCCHTESTAQEVLQAFVKWQPVQHTACVAFTFPNVCTYICLVHCNRMLVCPQVYQARGADANKPVTPQTLLAALRPIHDQIQKLALSEASNPNPFEEADSQLALIKAALPAAALVQNAVQPITSTVQQARALRVLCQTLCAVLASQSLCWKVCGSRRIMSELVQVMRLCADFLHLYMPCSA